MLPDVGPKKVLPKILGTHNSGSGSVLIDIPEIDNSNNFDRIIVAF